MSGVALLFILLIGLMMASVPVGISLGLSTLVTMVLTTNLDVITIPQYCFRGLDSFPLMAIPFFMLAGNLMKFGGLSEKLINLSNSLVRGFKGGLGHVTVLASMFFAALSGSAPATVMAIGSNVIPQMEKHGYDRGYATALASTAGTIGVIIPPSITFVVYGSISDTSIGSLFISGVIPGLLMGAALIIITLWLGRKSELKRLPKATGRQRWIGFKDAFWGLLMPVIILGGIYGGIFTPTEAAAVSAVYGLVIGIFIYKTLKIKQLKKILIDTASTTATVMFITAAATLFAYVLTRARIDVAISSMLTDIAGGNQIIFLLIVNVVLLIAGCFLNSTSALYIFTPLFVPVAQALGMNLIHFGTIMIVNLAIGLVTPPVGVTLYVACGIADTSLKKISVSVIPLLVAALIVLLLVTYVPSLSLCLLGG